MSVYPGRDLEAMAFAVNYHRQIARYFAPFLHGTVAEVGAGKGQFTEILCRQGIDRLYALEPAENLHAELKLRFSTASQVVPLAGTLAQALLTINQKLDAVVYCNVLEHIQDDFAEFHLCAGALKQGGALCVFVPALPFLMSDFDRTIGHCRRYMPQRLRALAESSGLAVSHLRWFDSVGILPWLVMMRWLRRGLNAGSVTTYDRWIVPWLMKIESVISPPLGKNLLMVAQRFEA